MVVSSEQSHTPVQAVDRADGPWLDRQDPLERVTGIEPAFSAWEADVLPLNYTRSMPHPIVRDDVPLGYGARHAEPAR